MSARPLRPARLALALAASLSFVVAAGCGAPGADIAGQDSTEVQPVRPTEPVDITVLDGAGNLVGSRVMFESFAEEHPELVSSVSFETASAPDVAGKVSAQQTAGDVSTSIVLGGPDVLGSAQAQGQLMQLYPAYQSDLPDLATIQDEPRAVLQDLAGGEGVLNRFTYSGPLLATSPGTVTDVPDTPEALLEWARANPGRFHLRPALQLRAGSRLRAGAAVPAG